MLIRTTVFYVIVTLLFMQWSGIHLHVNMHSQDASPHLSQMHGLDHQHDNHQQEVDVDLADISTSWFKLLQIFIVSVFLLLCLSLSYKTLRSSPISHHMNNRQAYWRPILRAPPASL